MVETLIQASDADRRAAITSYVEETLRDMPEAIRAGVAAESLLLGAWPALRSAAGRLDEAQVAAQVGRWEHSKIGLLRQYVRALHGIVLFAEHEMATGDGMVRPAPAVSVQP